MEDYWKEPLEYTYKKNIYSNTPRIIARIYRKEFFIYKSTAQFHTESILSTPGPLEITYISQRDYIRSSFQLHTSPRVSTPVSPRNYSRTPFYLHTYSLLFTLGSCIIDIPEKSNYHRDDTNLSSRWNVCIIMMKLIFHHDDNSISRLRKQWEYVYK